MREIFEFTWLPKLVPSLIRWITIYLSSFIHPLKQESRDRQHGVDPVKKISASWGSAIFSTLVSFLVLILSFHGHKRALLHFFFFFFWHLVRICKGGKDKSKRLNWSCIISRSKGSYTYFKSFPESPIQWLLFKYH